MTSIQQKVIDKYVGQHAMKVFAKTGMGIQAVKQDAIRHGIILGLDSNMLYTFKDEVRVDYEPQGTVKITQDNNRTVYWGRSLETGELYILGVK